MFNVLDRRGLRSSQVSSDTHEPLSTNYFPSTADTGQENFYVRPTSADWKKLKPLICEMYRKHYKVREICESLISRGYGVSERMIKGRLAKWDSEGETDTSMPQHVQVAIRKSKKHLEEETVAPNYSFHGRKRTYAEAVQLLCRWKEAKLVEHSPMPSLRLRRGDLGEDSEPGIHSLVNSRWSMPSQTLLQVVDSRTLRHLESLYDELHMPRGHALLSSGNQRKLSDVEIALRYCKDNKQPLTLGLTYVLDEIYIMQRPRTMVKVLECTWLAKINDFRINIIQDTEESQEMHTPGMNKDHGTRTFLIIADGCDEEPLAIERMIQSLSVSTPPNHETRASTKGDASKNCSETPAQPSLDSLTQPVQVTDSTIKRQEVAAKITRSFDDRRNTDELHETEEIIPPSDGGTASSHIDEWLRNAETFDRSSADHEIFLRTSSADSTDCTMSGSSARSDDKILDQPNSEYRRTVATYRTYKGLIDGTVAELFARLSEDTPLTIRRLEDLLYTASDFMGLELPERDVSYWLLSCAVSPNQPLDFESFEEILNVICDGLIHDSNYETPDIEKLLTSLDSLSAAAESASWSLSISSHGANDQSSPGTDSPENNAPFDPNSFKSGSNHPDRTTTGSSSGKGIKRGRGDDLTEQNRGSKKVTLELRGNSDKTQVREALPCVINGCAGQNVFICNMIRKIKVHGKFICPTCYDEFQNREDQEYHIREEPCEKQCVARSCRRHESIARSAQSVKAMRHKFVKGQCPLNRAELKKDQWRMLYAVCNPGCMDVPDPELQEGEDDPHVEPGCASNRKSRPHTDYQELLQAYEDLLQERNNLSQVNRHCKEQASEFRIANLTTQNDLQKAETERDLLRKDVGRYVLLLKFAHAATARTGSSEELTTVREAIAAELKLYDNRASDPHIDAPTLALATIGSTQKSFNKPDQHLDGITSNHSAMSSCNIGMVMDSISAVQSGISLPTPTGNAMSEDSTATGSSEESYTISDEPMHFPEYSHGEQDFADLFSDHHRLFSGSDITSDERFTEL